MHGEDNIKCNMLNYLNDSLQICGAARGFQPPAALMFQSFIK